MMSPREIRQRLLGCVGFSMLFHTGLLVVIALAPSQTVPRALELAEGILFDDQATGFPEGQQLDALHAAGLGQDSQVAAAEPLPSEPETKIEKVSPSPSIMDAAQAAPSVVVEPKDDQRPVQLPPKLASKSVDQPAPTKAVEMAPSPEAKAAETKPTKASEPKAVPAKNLAKPAPQERLQDESVIAAALAKSRSQRTPEPELDESAKIDRESDEIEEELTAAVAAQQEREQAAREAAERVFAQKTPTQAERLAVDDPSPVRREQQQVMSIAQSLAPSRENSDQGQVGAAAGRGADASFGIRDAEDLAEVPGNRPPEYPDRDRRLRNQGTVVFVAMVNADGTISDVRIEQSTQSTSLDMAAMNAMKRWRFLPGQAGLVRKGFTFNLGNQAEEMPARLRR